MFQFFKTAFFKATYLTKEFQMKHLILRAILKFCTSKKLIDFLFIYLVCNSFCMFILDVQGVKKVPDRFLNLM